MTRHLLVLLSCLYRTILHTFPAEFRAEFGGEMVELFGKRLDEVEKQGAWALIRLSSQEVGHWPSSAHYLYCCFLEGNPGRRLAT